jgi:hypothetical protein
MRWKGLLILLLAFSVGLAGCLDDTPEDDESEINGDEDDTPSRMMLTGFAISAEVSKEVRDEVLLLEGDEEEEVSENYVRLWWD